MAAGPSLLSWLAEETAAAAPFRRFDDQLPGPGTAFDGLLDRRVTAPPGPPEDGAFDDFAAKARNLARHFAGQPELLFLNARLVALLRRRSPPAHVPGLFAALWTAHHEDLSDLHDARWLISSARSLAEFGPGRTVRVVGAELAMLCDVLKLSETERLFTGRAPDALHPGRLRPARLMLDLDAFAIGAGDLDRSVVTRIWRHAQGCPISEALAGRLLPDLLGDPRGLFARLRRMRDRRRLRAAGDPDRVS